MFESYITENDRFSQICYKEMHHIQCRSDSATFPLESISLAAPGPDHREHRIWAELSIISTNTWWIIV